MRKNSYLYYIALAGVALAVPAFMTESSGKPAQPAKPAIAQAAPPPAAAVSAAPDVEELATIETGEYRAVVSRLNGGIKSFTLKDPQFRHDGRPIDVVTTDKKTVTIMLDAATVVMRGKTKVPDTEIKVGDRVSAETEEKGGMMMVKTLKLGTPAPAKK